MTAELALPTQRISGAVDFLVDTGADSTVLAPADARLLRIDVERLPPGPASRGVGSTTKTVSMGATLALGSLDYDLNVRMLVGHLPRLWPLLRHPFSTGQKVVTLQPPDPNMAPFLRVEICDRDRSVSNRAWRRRWQVTH